MFKPAVSRGRAVSVYLPFSAFAAVQPWAAGRARSARIAAILQRYTDEEAVFKPSVFEPDVFVEETFTGALIHEERTVGTRTFSEGQVAAGSFLGKSPAAIVELAIAWCEQVTAEIEQEARNRGVALV